MPKVGHTYSSSVGVCSKPSFVAIFLTKTFALVFNLEYTLASSPAFTKTSIVSGLNLIMFDAVGIAVASLEFTEE